MFVTENKTPRSIVVMSLYYKTEECSVLLAADEALLWYVDEH